MNQMNDLHEGPSGSTNGWTGFVVTAQQFAFSSPFYCFSKQTLSGFKWMLWSAAHILEKQVLHGQ
jgi:hypothetical protein